MVGGQKARLIDAIPFADDFHGSRHAPSRQAVSEWKKWQICNGQVVLKSEGKGCSTKANEGNEQWECLPSNLMYIPNHTRVSVDVRDKDVTC